MTPKQQERIKNKIKKIKLALAADKKFWGGYYHDGQGLRYIPPQLYLQLNDFTGGLRYFNWFNKNFPNDSGYPDFLFEWTVVLYSTGRLKEAEKKAFETFCSNIYLFDFYFGRKEGLNLSTQKFEAEQFCYSSTQENLVDFSAWLDIILATDRFTRASNKYLDIQKGLETESDTRKRQNLIRQGQQLVDESKRW